MKRFIICIISLILILLLASCKGTNNDDTQKNTSEEKGDLSNTNDEYIILENPVAKYGFKYNGYRFSRTVNGDDVIVISYDFLNKSDKSGSQHSLEIVAFQGAASLKRDIGFLEEGDPLKIDIDDVAPGESKKGLESFFILLDKGADIEFKVYPASSPLPREGEFYSFIIPMSGEKTYQDLKAEGLSPNILQYNVDIKGVRLSTDYLNGGDVAVIKFSFANLSPSVDYPPCVVKYTAYQNGIKLEDAYFVKDQSEAMSNFSRMVKGGYMLEEVEKSFKLIDKDTDIDLEISEHIPGVMDVPEELKSFTKTLPLR